MDRSQKGAVALAGATRSASGGILATALAVYVGRDGSPLAVGMLSAAFFFSMMVFTPLWGAVGDLTGRRRGLLVALSTALTGVAAAFVLAGSVPALIGLRAIYAVFAVGFAPLMLSLVGAMAGGNHRGRAAGYFASVVAAGDVGAQAAAGVMLAVLARSELFLSVAGLSLLGVLAVTRLRDPLESTRDSTDATGSLDARGVVGRVARQLLPTRGERAALRRAGLTWLYVALGIRHLAVKGVGSLLPIFLLTRVGLSTVTMGLLLTVGSAIQVVLTPRIGRLADATRRKRLIVAGVLLGGAYGPLLAAATVPENPSLRIAVGASALVALAVGFSVMDIATIALIGDAVPPNREAAFVGLRSTAAGAGGVLGPLLVGGLVVTVGYAVAFAATAGLALVAAAIVAATLVEPDRRTAVDHAPRTVEVSTHDLARTWAGRSGGESDGDSSRPDDAGTRG